MLDVASQLTMPQIALFAILALTLAGFIWGHWRYDVIAGLALLAAVYTGVVPAHDAFLGFGHPAVVTVAAVLVISRALQNSGLVNWFVRLLAPTRTTPSLHVAGGSGLTLLLSAVMNNVGALALMLPVTIRGAVRAKRAPSLLLIPLSFASLLGGLITLIGTPPNLVISAFREQQTGEPFAMFDFAPVGLVVALFGLAYLSLVGWRLLPRRDTMDDAGRLDRKLAAFVTEVRLPDASPFDGQQVRHIEDLCENEITVMAIIRAGVRNSAPSPLARVNIGDILVIQGDPTVWQPLCDGRQFEPIRTDDSPETEAGTQDVVIAEAVIMPGSRLEGRSVRGIRMHDTHGLNLLALARQGQPPRSRLRNTRFRVGDVILLQGDRTSLYRALVDLGCLILADRENAATVGKAPTWVAMGIFGLALLAAALAVVPVQIAFVSAVAALIVTRTISLEDAYASIEWPIIILLGALIPLGLAMKSTGAASIVAGGLASVSDGLPVWGVIALLMAASMWLSDVIHNTPTAVLMAPVSIGLAEALSLPADPFLMAVAVGSASAYLTPIGHQSNTLVMGPGGYKFADYTRVGAIMEVLILLVGVPMIMLVWMP